MPRHSNRAANELHKLMPVFQLIYRSTANAYFTDDDLILLLRQCRTKNIEKNVTGLLLYGHGSFIQLLEGEEEIVYDLYFNRIAHDSRHRNLVVLHRNFTPKRLFKDWSMAFQPLNSERVRDLSGYLVPEKSSKKGKNLLAPLRLLEVIQGFSIEMQRRD